LAICPLRPRGGECVKVRCEWFVIKECAIKNISTTLFFLKQDLIKKMDNKNTIKKSFLDDDIPF
jgi:hypothetical protein